MMNEEELIGLIPFGRNNGITKKKLMKKLNLDESSVVSIIKKLRKKYIILVDVTSGEYYRSNNEQELKEFIKNQQRQAYENNRTIMIAYKELEQLGGYNKE